MNHRSLVLVLALALVACKRTEPEGDALVTGETTARTESRDLLPALARPGRIVVVNIGAESGPRIELVDLDGTRRPLGTDSQRLIAVPYGHGHALLADVSGDAVAAIPVAGGEAIQNGYHIEEVLFAVSDDGKAALFYDYDVETKHNEAQLWNLRTGKGAGLPLPKLPICPLGMQGDIAIDGSEATAPCLPCECQGTTASCRMRLCRLRGEPHDNEVSPAAESDRTAPSYAPDGRLLFATNGNDTDAACTGARERCRWDLVAVPMNEPNAEPELVRVGAMQARFSRASDRMLVAAAVDPERRDCERWPCTGWELVVIEPDGTGEHRVATAESPAVPRVPFSLDDRWIAFDDRKGDKPLARACPIDASEPCKQLGAGLVTGWVRAVEDAQPPDDAMFFGCYRPDSPRGPFSAVSRGRLDAIMDGIVFRLAATSVTLWLDTKPEGRHFAVRFPARVDRLMPDTVFLEIDTPPGVPDDPSPTKLVPPLRIDRRIGALVLRRTDDGSLHADEHFLFDAMGVPTEQRLELRRIDCPADAPE